MGDDYDDKPSWRDIDRRKDRSRHVRQDRKAPSTPKARAVSERATQAYIKELDKLFQGKKGGKEHADLVKKIRAAYDTPRYSTLCNQYRKTYGMPDDWDTLILFLDHSKETVIEEAVKGLQPLVAQQPPERQMVFKARLETFSMTASRSSLQELAREVLEQL